MNSSDDTVLGGFGANQGFVLLEDSVLVFDTGFSKIQADALVSAVRETTDKPIKYIVNSHDHSDHVFGNSIVTLNAHPRRMQGFSAPLIISHSICKRRMEQNFTKRLAGYRNRTEPERLRLILDNIELCLPQLCYEDNALRINLEGQEMCLIHPETGAHTLGDTALALPKSGVLFAGDVLWNKFYPNLEDANLEGWIDFLSDVDVSTYQKLVPGHGDVCSSKDLGDFRDYLKQVRSNLVSIDGSATREMKRQCFLVPGTESWKLKLIIDLNVEALFGRTMR